MNDSFQVIDAPSEKTERRQKTEKAIIELLQSVIIALFIAVFVYVMVFTPNQVLSLSMQPTFEEHQLVLTTGKLFEWLRDTRVGEILGLPVHRGDVVVFSKPGDRDYIKRVVGLPGETIRVQDGNVYINDQLLVESYLQDTVYTQGGSFIREGEERQIPDGYYVMMGDNRPYSEDSRSTSLGFINAEWIRGKVIVRYWPLQDVGVINGGEFELQ